METVKQRSELESTTGKDGGTEYAARIIKDVQGIVDINSGKSGALIRVLQQSQEQVGYLPPDVLMAISRIMKIPLSEVNGVVSFYNFFSNFFGRSFSCLLFF
mgnify:CR=1 FL=1